MGNASSEEAGNEDADGAYWNVPPSGFDDEHNAADCNLLWQKSLDDGANSSSVTYLREILASEDSLRAAFEPVLRAASCSYTGAVDRDAFARAVVRISSYFNPSEPINLTRLSVGPPYTPDEALGHFRTALYLLADRLEEMSPISSRLPATPPAMSCGGTQPATFSSSMFGCLGQFDFGVHDPMSRFGSSSPDISGGSGNTGDGIYKSPRLGFQAKMEGEKFHSELVGRQGADLAQSQRLQDGLSMPRLRSAPLSLLPPKMCPATMRDAAAIDVAATVTSTTDRALVDVVSSATGDDANAQLEASRARVAGLRRALGREEELLQHQAEEAHFLEQLKKGLEVEVEAAEAQQSAIEAKQSSIDVAAEVRDRFNSVTETHAREVRDALHTLGPHSPGRVGSGQEPFALNCNLDGPLSLEDLKRHLQTVQFLRKRVTQLEGALDSREEQVAVLSDNLETRRASL